MREEFIGLLVFASVAQCLPFGSQDMARVVCHGFSNFRVGVGIVIGAEAEQVVE